MQVNSFRSIPMYKPEQAVTDTKDVGFAEKMAESSENSAMNALVSELEQKYGLKITVTDDFSKKAQATNAENATGHGNVVIASNIMKEMLDSPAKKAEIEKMIREHKDWLAFANGEMGKEGKEAVTSGLIIEPDGKMGQWVVGGDSLDGAMLNAMKPDDEAEDEWWLNIKDNVERERELRELMTKNQDFDSAEIE